MGARGPAVKPASTSFPSSRFSSFLVQHFFNPSEFGSDFAAAAPTAVIWPYFR
jgi:hypothetical protein